MHVKVLTRDVPAVGGAGFLAGLSLTPLSFNSCTRTSNWTSVDAGVTSGMKHRATCLYPPGAN